MSESLAGPIIGSVAGGLIGGDSNDDALEAQEDAARYATDEEGRQYDQTREDTAPWRNAGGSAINALSYEMGLSSSPNGAPGGGRSLDQITQQLIDSGRFNVNGGRIIRDKMGRDVTDKYTNMMNAAAWPVIWASMENNGYKMEDGGKVNWDALNKEASRLYSGQGGNQTYGGPGFGSLTKKFTEKDYYDDPVVKLMGNFALNEGTNALNQRFAVGGAWDSGEALKELTEYGSDYGRQSAGDSRSRFIQDQDNRYNRLAGISGTGQTATMGTAALGQRSVENQNDLRVGISDARGAASIANGKTWGNSLANLDWKKIGSTVINPNSGGYRPGEYINSDY